MNGEILKARILQIEPVQAELARKLGVSQQSLNQTFAAADIKTGFVEQLSALYERPISFFFGENNGIEVKDNDRSFNSNADEIIKELTSIIKRQEERIEQLTDKLLGI